MFAKKAPSSAPDRAYRKELDYLYARKSAVDTLIQSLEDYCHFRSKPSSGSKLNTA
jgi:hypothetical protein